MMPRARWWQQWREWLRPPSADSIPQALWEGTLARHPFLTRCGIAQTDRLRLMCAQFLRHKQFSGAHGLQISDEMAVSIAAQACLPVLDLGLHWYDDFRGIVVHPSAMLAPRQLEDEAGVMHQYHEELSGEAMPGGPVTLSWQDVVDGSPHEGYNLVIHEFAHKLDMRDGVADGAPPMPSRDLARRWTLTMQAAYERFTEALALADRFGGPKPWLDPYAATAPAEFFAVACEAYFVNRERFAMEWPDLTDLFDAFFRGEDKPSK